eukprot:scaffold3725_cov114-Cylindrotheca_fusiformis.AAC.2
MSFCCVEVIIYTYSRGTCGKSKRAANVFQNMEQRDVVQNSKTIALEAMTPKALGIYQLALRPFDQSDYLFRARTTVSRHDATHHNSEYLFRARTSVSRHETKHTTHHDPESWALTKSSTISEEKW